MRRAVRKGRDKKIFARTAKKTNALNVTNIRPRGGVRR